MGKQTTSTKVLTLVAGDGLDVLDVYELSTGGFGFNTAVIDPSGDSETFMTLDPGQVKTLIRVLSKEGRKVDLEALKKAADELISQKTRSLEILETLKKKAADGG